MARKRFEYVGVEETVMDCVRTFQRDYNAQSDDSITYTQVMRAGLEALGLAHNIPVCDGMTEPDTSAQPEEIAVL